MGLKVQRILIEILTYHPPNRSSHRHQKLNLWPIGVSVNSLLTESIYLGVTLDSNGRVTRITSKGYWFNLWKQQKDTLLILVMENLIFDLKLPLLVIEFYTMVYIWWKWIKCLLMMLFGLSVIEELHLLLCYNIDIYDTLSDLA